MTKPKKVEVRKEREVNTYSELWHASECVLRSGIEQDRGSTWQFLSSILLTAFTFEAYLNHVGQRNINCWADLEYLPPLSKFKLLCETLHVSFDGGEGARPIQTINELFNFRNKIAHGKSAKINNKPELLDINDNLDKRLAERVLTDWEKLIQTSEFAKKARQDVELVIKNLHEARKDEKEFLFTFGLGLYSANLIESQND